MQPQPRFEAQRILLVLHGSIGDVTRALPLVGLLRNGYPKAYIAWSVEPAAAPLLQGKRELDEVIVFDRRQWWRTFFGFLRQVRRRKFDLVLDLQRHFKSGMVSRVSGAGRRLGFHRRDAKEFNWLFNNLFIDHVGTSVSKFDHYLKFVEFLGLASAPIEWDFGLTELECSSVNKHLAGVEAPFATIFLATRWQSKNWFADQIAGCANLLRQQYQLTPVLLGGSSDRQLAEEVMALAGVRVINLAGRTNLREAIGIICRAKLAIGPDTGLMHIAAAVNVPVVSLWGATDPARTGPYRNDGLVIKGVAPCSPCYQKHCTIGRQCLRSIGMDEIAGKIKLAIDGAATDYGQHAECG